MNRALLAPKTFTRVGLIVFINCMLLVGFGLVGLLTPKMGALATYATEKIHVTGSGSDSTKIDGGAAIKGDVGMCSAGTTVCANVPRFTFEKATGKTTISGTDAADYNTFRVLFGNYELIQAGTAAQQINETIISGTQDTTAGALSNWAGEFGSEVTKVAGANVLTNTGVLVHAAGADVNFAIDSTAGDWRLGGGGNLNVSGTTGVVALNASGLVTPGKTGTALDVPLGDVNFHQNAVIGTNASQTLALNASVTTDIIMTSVAADMILRLTNGAAGGHNIAWDNGGTAGFFGASKFTMYDNTSARIDWQIDNATGDFAVPVGAVSGVTVATGGATGSRWSSGAGDPNGSVNCNVGDLFSRTDGGLVTSLYVCTAANTWTGK